MGSLRTREQYYNFKGTKQPDVIPSDKQCDSAHTSFYSHIDIATLTNKKNPNIL